MRIYYIYIQIFGSDFVFGKNQTESVSLRIRIKNLTKEKLKTKCDYMCIYNIYIYVIFVVSGSLSLFIGNDYCSS